MRSLLLLSLLLGACELRGLTNAQLYGPSPDAAVAADGVTPGDVAPPPDAAAPGEVAPVDAGAPDMSPDLPPPLPLVMVTGAVHGICDGHGVMIGGAGAHTCSFEGKGSYTLRLRNVVPGTRVELVARRPGYTPDPNTVIITVEPGGVQHDFIFKPVTGSCDRDAAPPDPGPCICNPDAGCEPS
jgi:hypothetical protein